MNVLLGPTLSGKTTLMRLMAGLDRPASGRVIAGGNDVTGVPVRRRSVAMVYQQFINYPSLTVYENIASPLRVAGVRGQELDNRVREAARVLGLEPLLARLPAQLSGGQQQRTAIARAIVKSADLVLLDEPLANLDYKLREELREELPRIFKATGAILVYATTEPPEALLLGGQHRDTLAGQAGAVRADVLGLSPADQYRLRARIFRPAAQRNFSRQARRRSRSLGEYPSLAGHRPARGLSDGDYTTRFRGDRRASSTALAAHPSILRGSVSLAEISGSETFVHVETASASLSASSAASARDSPGSRSICTSMRRASSSSIAAGALVARAPNATGGGPWRASRSMHRPLLSARLGAPPITR